MMQHFLHYCAVFKSANRSSLVTDEHALPQESIATNFHLREGLDP